MDMLSYMLDLADKDTPGDQYPSANKLAEMFDLKLQWVVSIGFALRTDTKYPVYVPILSWNGWSLKLT
jgi:hypothetical protein